MCGIVGYVGERNCVPLILEGLRRLEYRGYDSAGIALIRNGGLFVQKNAGKVADLAARLAAANGNLQSVAGMGHTRWATHGEPNDVNAHPHWDCRKRPRHHPQRDHRELRHPQEEADRRRAHHPDRDRYGGPRAPHRRDVQEDPRPLHGGQACPDRGRGRVRHPGHLGEASRTRSSRPGRGARSSSGWASTKT